MRIPIMAGNWKMHMTVGEAVDFVTGLQKALGDWKETEAVVAPPFVALAPVAERLKGGPGGLYRRGIPPHVAGPGMPVCDYRALRAEGVFW